MTPNTASPSTAPNPQSTSSDLDGQSVLLTGGSGFIGRHLLRRLLEAGARVVATTRGAVRSPAAAQGQAEWRQVDLSDSSAVAELMDEIEPGVIFHLASHVAGSRDLDLVWPTFEGNLMSTLSLLTAAEKVGGVRRFVQVGSLEEPDLDQPVAIPSSPYAAAKAAASSYGRMFHLLYGTPVVLARVFMVYGPGPQDEKKLVPYVIQSLLAGEDPRLSSGARPVDWVYVEDVAEGLSRLATQPDLEGQQVDLGSGALSTVGEVVEELYRQIAPQRRPQFGDLSDRKAEQVRRADQNATRRALGWAPGVSLEDGIARTIEFFRR